MLVVGICSLVIASAQVPVKRTTKSVYWSDKLQYFLKEALPTVPPECNFVVQAYYQDEKQFRFELSGRNLRGKQNYWTISKERLGKVVANGLLEQLPTKESEVRKKIILSAISFLLFNDEFRLPVSVGTTLSDGMWYVGVSELPKTFVSTDLVVLNSAGKVVRTVLNRH